MDVSADHDGGGAMVRVPDLLVSCMSRSTLAASGWAAVARVRARLVTARRATARSTAISSIPSALMVTKRLPTPHVKSSLGHAGWSHEVCVHACVRVS